jgi:hypothetical protein
VIRGDDDEQFHTPIGGQCALGIEHLLPVAVAARSGQSQRRARILIVAGVSAERTAHQFKTTIEPGGLTMSFAYEGAFTASNKPHSYFWHWNVHRDFSLFEADSGGFSKVKPHDYVTGYIATEI